MANDYTVVPEDLKKQLALAARSIQWSYAIFWSISSAQPHGELKWGEGYYNGDIKTRKTVQSAELNADQLGLHRSEQLRELFMSLSAGEANPQARRPTAALSPEDLTDTEWYYLVCMSFSFDIGNGLPGRTYANGQINWLCNAHNADSKVFTRSLLAKSASIQTVVCFPFLGGVIELGVTEMVLEDPNLIQHIKTSFLEVPFPIAAANMSTRSNENFAGSAFDHEILESKFVPVIGCEELKAVSLDKISDDQLSDDSFMVEELNGGASLGLMDDDFSNCIPHSMNSSDCISQTIVDPVKAVPVLNSNLFMKHDATDVQDFNQTKLTALDLRSNDLHYQGVLASLLKNSHPLILGPNFRKCKWISSFVSWKKVGLMHLQKSSGNSQSLLKKILIQVPKMYVKGFNESHENKSNRVVLKPETDDVNACHKSLNGKQKGKLIERFSILKSIVPSISKVDEVSILDDTIQYLQKLEKRVEELETCREFTEFEAIRTRRKPQDVIERTSDNYGNNKIGSKLINKRKARDIDEPESEINYNSSKECSSDNVNVSINDKDVLIEIKCPLREGLFLEIMEATSHLKLDSLSVQSSTSDGILSLTIKSKKGYNAVSARTIKQAIQRVAEKC